MNRRRTINIAIVLGMILAAAAMIGFFHAAMEEPKLDIPTSENTAAGKSIPIRIQKALNYCNGAPAEAIADCVALDLRPAYTIYNKAGARIHTPNGHALVRECMTQGYSRAEVKICLRQPIS